MNEREKVIRGLEIHLKPNSRCVEGGNVMITWEFALVALLIGWSIGMLAGVLIAVSVEMREGGDWSKGFFEGCDKEALINYLRREKEEMEWRKVDIDGRSDQPGVDS